MPAATGVMPAPVSQAFDAGLFDLPTRPLTATSATQSRWNVAVIMVGFPDAPLTHTAAEFQKELFDTTGATPSGSVFDYYQWVSGGRLRVTGKIVATVNLGQNRSYYAAGGYGLARESTPENIFGLVRDALLTCPAGIDWSQFDVDHDGMVDMLWILHAGIGGETSPDRSNIWSITSRLTGGWRFGATFLTPQLLPGATNEYYAVDRFSTVPELSFIIPGRAAEIGTFCHEFGHALGLPDLYDTSGIPAGFANSGPGFWSLMSLGGYGGSGLSPERPSHIGGWCQHYLGWADTFRPSMDSLYTLRPIGRCDPILDLWSQGEASTEHFLVENRAQESFDVSLPAPGLIITHVDEVAMAARLAANKVNTGPSPALMIIEGDGDFDLLNGRNRGDASDPLPGATGRTFMTDQGNPGFRTFAGAYADIAIGSIQPVGNDMRFQIQVQPPGWQPRVDVTPPDPVLLDSSRPGRWAVADHEQRVYAVRSEAIVGKPQIVLHSRLANTWIPPEVISTSSAGAFDPSIALLPGGDLAVAWTDVRAGRSQIYYRARIRGQWSTETAISTGSGDSHHVSLGADSHGMVEGAWINELAGGRQLMFKRFAYLSPFGTPSPVTFAGEMPDPPSLAVAPTGATFIVWADRDAGPSRIFFARYHPDSGLSTRQPLTFSPAAPQLSVSAAIDPDGTLHTVWQVGGAGFNELHYQARKRSQAPYPPDTLIEASSNVLQNPSVACDDSGTVHVTYEDWGGGLPTVIYKRKTQDRGWDLTGTNLADAEVGAIHPITLPYSPSNVTVLAMAQTNDNAWMVERRRIVGPSATLDVPAGAALPAGGFHVGPNPLRPGSRLALSGEGADPIEWVDVYDLSGRRVASLRARSAGTRFTATLDASVTSGWPGGVYFARPRGTAVTARFVLLR